MKKLLVNLAKSLGLYSQGRWIYTRSIILFWRLWGSLSNRNARVLSAYQNDHNALKLHLGCGLNYLHGWLNTDLWPDRQRIYMDITKRFTFPDNSFDFVFSEHVIEHMPYQDGLNMLKESFRVLKPRGVLRLVTPDIHFLIDLYQNPEKPLHKDYIAWNASLFIKDRAPHTALSVVNNYVRDWGHQYIYDPQTLMNALKECGFEDIRHEMLMQSEYEALQGLENAHRHPDGFLALESLVIEARKS